MFSSCLQCTFVSFFFSPETIEHPDSLTVQTTVPYESTTSSLSSSSMTIRTKSKKMLLILGAGWTSTFLIPQLQNAKIPYAATSTTGRDSTLKFVFDPDSTDTTPYEALPSAQVVLITFPLKGHGQSKLLTDLYTQTHPNAKPHFIQLGSTGIFTAPHWNNSDSSYDTTNDRAIAEDELIALGGCVLNLAGLYGGARDPKHWLVRVATSKEQVRGKKALHMIHGEDVARAIIAVYRDFTPKKRWLIADLHVYDWWDLIMEWGQQAEEKRMLETGEKLEYRKWVVECMGEEGVRALPRDTSSLGRILDSRDFWQYFKTWPSQGSIR